MKMPKNSLKSTNKTLILSLCCVFLCLGMVNLIAADGLNFDNSKSWDELTKTLTVENLLGLGDDVASWKLLTPHNNLVIEGKNRIVAEFNVSFGDDENNVFNDMEFYYIDKQMQEFGRSYTWMYREVDYVYQVPITGESYIDGKEMNGDEPDYDSEVIGYENITMYKWTEIKDNTLSKGGNIIGLQTEVREGDYVEFIPTILGVRMPEFASWNASLNVALKNYYSLDTTTGLTEIDLTGNCHLVNDSSITRITTTDNPNMILPDGRGWSGVAATNEGLYNTTCLDGSGFQGGIGTLCAWMQHGYDSDSCSGTQEVMFTDVGGSHRIVTQADCDWGLYDGEYGAVGGIPATTYDAGEWWLMCARWDNVSDNYEFSKNGTIFLTGNISTASVNGTGFYVGTNQRANAQDYTGNMSEIMIWHRWLSTTELLEVFNEGAGLSLSATVSIKYPTNTTYGSVTQLNYTTNGDDSCWYSNDSGITNSSYISAGTNWTGLYYPPGRYMVTVYCNDSTSPSGNDIIHFTITTFTEFAQDFVKFTNEMKNEVFNISIQYDSSSFSSLSANLVHNQTSYIGTRTGSAGHYNFTKAIDIPVTNGQVNKTFYWDILMTNTTGSFHYNSTIGTQQINETLFVSCNDTYNTHHLVNFTIFNETDKSPASANFDATFSYWIGAGTQSKNYSIDTSGKNQSFCSNFNDTFYVDSIINLDANTTFQERTYEFSEMYTNTTTHTPLFLLPYGNGTKIIIILRDAGLVPLENYIVEIERYYPETNTYELVMSQETDIYGQTVTRLVENTVKYKFKFIDDSGTTRKETGDILIACRASPCVLPFVIEDDADDYSRFDNVTDYDWIFSFSNVTNIFTFVWTDVSEVGATNWLEVKRLLWNGTTTVCNVSSVNVSGSLTCDVGSSRADYQAQVYRRVDSGDWRRIGVLSIEVGADWPTFGKEGMIWSFFFLMTCLAIGYWKPPVGFATFGLGIVLLGYMNIISLAPSIIIAFMVIIGLAIWSWRG